MRRLTAGSRVEWGPQRSRDARGSRSTPTAAATATSGRSPLVANARAERLATDGAWLYFTRDEELGDVWTTTGLSAPSSLTC